MIDLCIVDRATDAMEFKPICSTATFDKYWRPAINKLDLELLKYLPNMVVVAEIKSQFLLELERLEMWTESVPDSLSIQAMQQTIKDLREELEPLDFEKFRIDFG